MTESYRTLIQQAKTWVVKIGSSLLTDSKGELDPTAFRRLASDIAALTHQNKKVILVSSGAVACGMAKLGLKRKPREISQKQAIAAVGQSVLMNHYEKVFAKKGLGIAQILLTREDLSHRHRYLNARHAIAEILQFGLIPIINENDTVSVEEIRFGDNDNLSALVTNVVEADLLVILTDRDGLYTADPRTHPEAERIPLLKDITDEVRGLAKDTQRLGSTGGMITKLEAAQKAAYFGIPTLIASGHTKNGLKRLALGEDLGTLILAQNESAQLNRRKHWMAYALKPLGEVIVDAGAAEALLQKGKSLLPSGVRWVKGNFGIGDPVDLKTEEGKVFARGLVTYSSSEIEKIRGAKTTEIEKILGYKYLDEVIHRDDLVLIQNSQQS